MSDDLRQNRTVLLLLFTLLNFRGPYQVFHAVLAGLVQPRVRDDVLVVVDQPVGQGAVGEEHHLVVGADLNDAKLNRVAKRCKRCSSCLVVKHREHDFAGVALRQARVQDVLLWRVDFHPGFLKL